MQARHSCDCRTVDGAVLPPVMKAVRTIMVSENSFMIEMDEPSERTCDVVARLGEG